MSEAAVRYIVNPDVSCREEGPEGALLYDPDADRALVVNATGLLIWRVLERPHTLEEVVAALLERCNNVPLDEVHRDVGEFIAQLHSRGFIGIYGGSAT
ncbi:MAG: PqqD family peptide modification chaperone [Chloroflexia bacterium]